VGRQVEKQGSLSFSVAMNRAFKRVDIDRFVKWAFGMIDRGDCAKIRCKVYLSMKGPAITREECIACFNGNGPPERDREGNFR